MARSSQLWTVDEIVGASLAVVGMVALLVKADVLQLGLNFAVPASVLRAWPFVLIGTGVVLWWWQKRRAQTQTGSPAENGERK